MGLQVIGAGFGRTGTSSLKAALEYLGYEPCYHMFEVVKDNRKARGWWRAAHGELKDWDEIMAGYRAAVDWPAAAFYRELMQAYPDAKIILTERDPDAWYDSVRETIYGFDKLFPSWLKRLLPNNRMMGEMVNKVVWQDTFDGRFEEREHAIAVFKQNSEEVKRVVPAEQLLVYRVADGWEPLCRFLGKPVPDMPFPNTNSRREMKRRFALMRAVIWAPVVLLAAIAIAIVAALV